MATNEIQKLNESLRSKATSLPRAAVASSREPSAEANDPTLFESQNDFANAKNSSGEDEIGGLVPVMTRTRQPIQPHQRHFLAKAAAQGISYGEMAKATSHTNQYIKGLFEGDSELIELVEHYREATFNAMVDYKIKFLEMLPKALDVVDTSFNGDDRARQWAADKVFKEAAQQAGPQVAINLNAGVDPEQQRIVKEAVVGITDAIRAIEEQGLVAQPMERFIKTTIPGPEDVIGHDTRKSAAE